MAVTEGRKTTEARRRANAAWDGKNMATLSCRVRVDMAKAYKDLCESRGSTAGRELLEFVKRELAEAQQARPVGDCAERSDADEVLE